jgi:hypothetical protein
MAVDEMRLNPLDEQACAAVAALADGEPVDVNALRLALGDPAVRDYLVDLLALRQAVRGLNGQSPLRWRDRRAVSRRIGWLSAAAVVVSLSAGYLAGQRSVQAAPAPTMETVVHLPGAPAAPEPTRVISLRPGVNWTEKAGAN